MVSSCEDMEEKSSALARAAAVNDISSVLDDTTKLLEEIRKRFGWDQVQHATDSQPAKTAQCPFDHNHVMQPHCIDKHVEKCRLKRLGIDTKKDKCQSSCFFYENSSSVVSILPDNTSSSNPALPVDVLHSEQSGEERLRCYDNVVEIGKSKRKINELELLGDTNAAEGTAQGGKHEFKSKLEMLAEQRDYKRRRQSYRAKNVHITKRTPTDIMREIIDNRMQEVRQIYEEENSSAAHD